ncbi:MAG: hypothetical protein L6R40_002449 [Gallowayella cf. fulva]|nr:MAG: hypothetical protein L6R40_002449 [Xanthomendoza cf. fulva]
MNDVVRRGVWTCLACSTIPRSPIATVAAKHTGSKHQRNHSSSKASSSSKDDARPPAAASEAPAEEEPIVSQPAEKRSTGRRASRIAPKQAAAKARRMAYPNIPSVPSTQHLHPKNVHLASLFSQDRPISVTQSLPSPSTEKQFSSIFESKTPPTTPFWDVIYTVSSAIASLENAAVRPEPWPPGTTRSQATTETTHLDGGFQQVTIDVNELSKHFRPYVAPPPPVPFDQSAKPINPPSSKRQKPVKQRTFSTTLTITEEAHPNGHKTYQARISPMREDHFTPNIQHMPSTVPQTYADQQEVVEVIDITPPSGRQPFRERMRNRHQTWEEGLVGKKKQIWRAISVRRQRKLKMKKHKYKKLMRKTRNLRRRMDKN